MKRWLLFLAKLLLTVACLWWALRGVDLRESILVHPERWDAGWIGLGLLFAGLTMGLTGLRLWLLLRAQGVSLGLWRATELTLIGNLFNLVGVGGVGGDAARIFLLIRDHPERKLAVTLTVMFDHLVGLVAMALVFFVLTAGRFEELASQSAETRAMLRFAWVFFAGGLVFVAALFVLASPPVHRVVHGGGRQWKWEILRRMPEIYDVYRKRWPRVLAALAVSVVMMPVYYASFWCAARATGSDVAAGPVLVVMPVVDMLAALPLSVAGLGVREASMSVLMKDLTGMEAGTAVAASLLGFGFTLAWALVGGGLFLRPRDRARVSEIQQVAEEGKDA